MRLPWFFKRRPVPGWKAEEVFIRGTTGIREVSRYVITRPDGKTTVLKLLYQEHTWYVAMEVDDGRQFHRETNVLFGHREALKYAQDNEEILNWR